jgi:hypothetical protein
MFQIRSEHLRHFEQARTESFLDRLCALLCAHFPDAQQASGTSMRAALDRALRKASAHGLRSEQEQAVYCVAAWLMGEDFDVDQPQVQTVLSSARLSGAEKVSWLDRYTREMFSRLQGA